MHGALVPHVAAATLFDSIRDVLYCVKDADGRYLAVNHAFADRACIARDALIGMRALEVFPEALARRYDAQDAELRHRRQPLVNELELITQADGGLGWYLTGKLPVIDSLDEFVGSVVVSTDLRMRAGSGVAEGLASVVAHVSANLAQALTVTSLAVVAELSVSQLERRMHQVYGLSPKQFVVKMRVDEACRRLLGTSESLAHVAAHCGWYDQSAFSRQFVRIVGMPPGEFRLRGEPTL